MMTFPERILGLYEGEGWISDDFDDELPDSFWFGDVDDDTLWDKKFADTQDLLDHLGDKAHAAYIAGLSEDFDPDDDPDAI